MKKLNIVNKNVRIINEVRDKTARNIVESLNAND